MVAEYLLPAEEREERSLLFLTKLLSRRSNSALGKAAREEFD
jgi:hypothetical protein